MTTLLRTQNSKVQSPKREEPGKTGAPCVKGSSRVPQGKQAHPVFQYRVPQGSQPRHGWATDPPMVGIRSPIGLVVGSCTSHPGVLGSIPKREEPGETDAPCVKVPGSSRVPPHANSFVIGPAVIKHTQTLLSLSVPVPYGSQPRHG
jgi:hypothetical protein